jgi:hypothetical protein
MEMRDNGKRRVWLLWLWFAMFLVYVVFMPMGGVWVLIGAISCSVASLAILAALIVDHRRIPRVTHESLIRALNPDADNAQWALYYGNLAVYAHDTGCHGSAGYYEGLAARYRRLPPTDSHRVEFDIEQLRARLDSLAAQIQKESEDRSP